MAIVIHTIKNNRYAYHHYREGKKVRAEYIAPVDSRGRVRALKVGDGVDRAEIGTTHERLKAIYMKAIRKKEIEDIEVKPKPKVVKKEPEKVKVVEPKPKRVVTAKRVEIVELKPKEVKPKIIEFESEKEKDEYMKKLKPGESIEYTYRDNDRIMRGSESYESLQKEKKEKEKYEKERIEQRKKEREQWEKEAEEHEKYLKSPEYKKLKKEQEEEETKAEEERAKKDYEEYMKKRGYGTTKAEEERFIKDNKKRHAKIEEQNKKNYNKFVENYKSYKCLDFTTDEAKANAILADKEHIKEWKEQISEIDMGYFEGSMIESYPDDPEPFRGRDIPQQRKHILKNHKQVSDSIVTFNMAHTKGKRMFDKKERKTPITREEALKNSKDDLDTLDNYVKKYKLVDDKIVER